MKNIFEKEKFNILLSELVSAINPVIEELLDSYVSEEIQKIVRYQTSTGGKRIRSILAVLSCRLLGGQTKDVLYPAAGLELLHNYSLIIDDIIDNSNLRRGLPTTWSKFGKSIAQCIAIDYSAAAFQAANQSSKPFIMSDLFAKTIKTIVDGEILDILFEQAGRDEEPYVLENRYREISQKDYFRMISRKTATLFQACCEAGAICAEAEQKEVDALKEFGFNLGMAFQIQDDILDIFGEEKTFGKKIGKDIEERKGGNIVIILALEELNSNGRNDLLELIRKERTDKKEIAAAIKLIEKTKAREKARLAGKKFIERARKNLEILPQNEWSDILREIAEFIIQREK